METRDEEAPLLDPEHHNTPDSSSQAYHTLPLQSKPVALNIILSTATFLAILSLGFLIQRLACLFDLPDDCLASPDALELFNDSSTLIMYGIALSWLVDIPGRWPFLIKQWYAWLIFPATPIIYSAISNITILKFTLDSTTSLEHLATITLLLTITVILSAVLYYHIVMAIQHEAVLPFLLPRLLLMLFFIGWMLELSLFTDHAIRVHLHHLYIGWGIAIWGAFNKPLSVCVLVIGMGIFVQGLASYSAMPVFEKSGCLETPSSRELSCRFWIDDSYSYSSSSGNSGGSFTLLICPAAGGTLPRYECNTNRV